MFSIVRLAALLLVLLTVALPRAWADPFTVVTRIKADITRQLGAESLAALKEVDDGSRTAGDLEALAHGLTLSRHFSMAAWLYASSIERDPTSAASWSSLGVLLAEGASLERGAKPDEQLLESIVELQREARRLNPSSPPIANNLGGALTALGRHREDRAKIEEGAFLIYEATQGNPRSSIYYVRLAEALKLIGETSAAQKFLEAAFQLNSAHPTLVTSRASGGLLSDLPLVISEPALCEVNFDCDNKCPKSIIGQIDLVTCKMSEASAQSGCREGKAFPRFFDCSAKIPKFGILIPGLDPGLSILTPWGSLDFVVQGDGRVDFKVKINGEGVDPVQPSFQTQGSWQPSRGTVALDHEAGVQVNLFNSASPVFEQANAYDVGISVVEKYNITKNSAQSDIEIGRGGVLTD
ncbi:tetratricopeptide repeat protein [Aestuariivirga sp.]|uniref:tetratricopeptide repeat protein n=1 Tax=Aestuariivirga sp. TaxID=2650926 RepID=UPI00391966A1